MVEYKYKLSTSSRKYVCPHCGHKTFTPYVDRANNIIDVEKFGRCDRENNCGYLLYPTDVETHIVEGDIPDPAPQKPMRINITPKQEASNLFFYACDLIGIDKAVKAWCDYKIGSYNDGVVFYQIDHNYEVHSGKVIYYQDNGHRRKDKMPTWLHKLPSYTTKIVGDTLVQCFFGQHLITPDVKEIVIVESEKTAALYSQIDARGRTYIATGGADLLPSLAERAMAQGLFNRKKVILIPDNGMYKKWLKVATKYNWKIDDICDHVDEVGCDILDCYEWLKNEPNKLTNNEELLRYICDK